MNVHRVWDRAREALDFAEACEVDVWVWELRNPDGLVWFTTGTPDPPALVGWTERLVHEPEPEGMIRVLPDETFRLNYEEQT